MTETQGRPIHWPAPASKPNESKRVTEDNSQDHRRSLAASGECGRLIAAFDWSKTELGPIETWSTSLRTATSILLRSRVPIVMLWGEDGVMLYNDAYSVFAGGRHPHQLGLKVRDGWPEVADFNQNVMRVGLAGGTLAYRDQELTLHRHGRPEQVFMNLDYSPVLDEDGRPAGVLAIVVETTERVMGERRQAFMAELDAQLRRLDDPIAMMAEATAALGRQLGAAQVGFGEIDAAGEYVEVQRDWGDGRIPSVVGTWRVDDYGPEFYAAMRAGETVAMPDIRTHPWTCAPEIVAAYAGISTRSILNVPLMAGGRMAAILFVNHPEPREWSPADITLTEDVAARLASAVERARAEAARDRAAALGAAQNRVLELAVGDATLRQTLEAIVTTVEGLSTSGVLTSISLLGVDGVHLRHGAAPSLPDAYNDAIDGTAIGPAVRSCGTAVHRGEPVLVSDIAVDPLWADFRDLALAHGLRACWSVPIRSSQGDILGTFAMYHREPREPTAVDLEIVDFVVRTAGLVIQRSNAEAAVREREERLRLAVDNADVGFWDVDVVNDTLTWPPRTKAMFGISAEVPVTMQDFYDGLHPDDRAATSAAYAAAADPEARALYDVEYRTIGKEDGVVRWVEAKGRGVFDADGRCLRVAGTAVQITARKEAEEALRELNATLEARVAQAIAEREEVQEALRQSQKMEAMGQLTGGVAHDFNNLLTPIVGSLDMLQRKGLGGEREQRLIAGAAQSAERAKTLVQRLLAFARRQPLQPVPVDVARLVTGMGDLVSSTTGPQIKVSVEAPNGLPPAKADPNQLEMAILNLAVNARDAMPDGGTLRISASRDPIRPGHRSNLRTGHYIRLSVADTGTGMDEATLARAVEPFFSTKGIGKGTGLGLSMVHGLASQLGGAMAIQSRPGLGTNVELWLPQSTDFAEVADVAHDISTPSIAGTALLVDDEELVRMSTADMLNDLGYSVIEAVSGEDAMRLVEEGQAFDLLVTDHLMPGMNGTDLAMEVRAARPDVPVLLVSGYAENEGIDPGLPRLTKPFRKDELAASLAQLSH